MGRVISIPILSLPAAAASIMCDVVPVPNEETDHSLWWDSVNVDLIKNRAYIGDGLKADYWHHVVCGKHPLFGIFFCHPKDEFDKKERFMTLVVVLSIAILVSANQHQETCCSLARCSADCTPDIAQSCNIPQDRQGKDCNQCGKFRCESTTSPEKCEQTVRDNTGGGFFLGLFLAVIAMVFDSCMKTCAKCSCVQGRMVPTSVTKCFEAIGKRAMGIFLGFSILMWFGALTTIESISDQECKIEVYMLMAWARVSAWFVALPLSGVPFFMNWKKQRKQHCAYLEYIVNVDNALHEEGACPELAGLKTKAAHQLTAICREAAWNIDTDQEERQKFYEFWNEFKKQEGLSENSDVQHEAIVKFQSYTLNRIEDELEKKYGVDFGEEENDGKIAGQA